MTKEECLAGLRECVAIGKGDPETAHVLADDTLLAFLKAQGHEDVVDLFNDVNRWYS